VRATHAVRRDRYAAALRQAAALEQTLHLGAASPRHRPGRI
jgi:hypothetical protein